MYELKKNGKLFMSKFVGTGPSSYEKKNLQGRGFTKVEKHWSSVTFQLCVKCGLRKLYIIILHHVLYFANFISKRVCWWSSVTFQLRAKCGNQRVCTISCFAAW